jgi:hypothetical protein
MGEINKIILYIYIDLNDLIHIISHSIVLYRTIEGYLLFSPIKVFLEKMRKE